MEDLALIALLLAVVIAADHLQAAEWIRYGARGLLLGVLPSYGVAFLIAMLIIANA